MRTVADLARAPVELLERALGPRLGEALQRKANGIDERPVERSRERK